MDGHVLELLVLSFGWRFDDDHFGEDHVFSDADFCEVSAEDESSVEDGVVADFDVVGGFDEAFFSDEVFGFGLIELSFLIVYFFFE